MQRRAILLTIAFLTIAIAVAIPLAAPGAVGLCEANADGTVGGGFLCDGDDAPPPTNPFPESVPPVAGACPDGVTIDDLLVPGCGAYLGSSNRQQDGLDLSIQEAIADRQFAMVRIYRVGPDAQLFTADAQRLADEGRTIVASWKVATEGGDAPPWARVARGDYDAELARFATEIADSGHTVMFSLHHEPEDNVGRFGTDADYAAMMRRAHEVMEPIAGDQIVWFINYMGHSFGSFDQVEAMYPGDDVIDWISWNPYNWFDCHDNAPWKGFEEQARPFYEWAQENHPDKPLMIGETATNEDPADPGRKAAWIQDMGAALQTEFPAIKALLWFHQSTDTNFCERRWDSSPESIAAFTTLAADPYFAP